MERELRPRRTRPSYATMAGLGHDDPDSEAAGPSKPAAVAGEDSGSDFAPEGPTPEPAARFVKGGEIEDQDGVEDIEEMELQEESATISIPEPLLQENAPRRTRKEKGKEKASSLPASKTPAVKLAPGLSRPPNRQMYALPTPSVHHRHRAVALFSRTGRVERLESPPALFGPPKTVPTNNFTHNSVVTDRTNKAWGYNVGPGPLWELTEDRGWFKEAHEEDDDVEREANRRPKVHGGISVKSGWEILKPTEASLYLPTDTVTTDEGNFKPPPPIACHLGPFGKQIRAEIDMFDVYKMSEFFPESKAHIFNAGAPVWGLDWCPIHPDDRPYRSYKQYLAVAPFPSRSHAPEIGKRVHRPSYACIQIWALRPTRPVQVDKKSAQDAGEVSCEMVLCLDGGPAHEIKWCPLPSHDNLSDMDNQNRPRKLGLIAGTFEDGSLSFYVVPDPLDVTPANHDPSQPVYIKIQPLLRIELDDAACWTLDWANSELIAVGTTSGTIAVYDIARALNSSSGSNIFPTHYLTVHQSAIRALAWIRVPPSSATGLPRVDQDPTVIASGGYDGMECLTDIREGNGCVMNRTRDVINAMAFAPFAGGPITIDHENIVKAYSASPSMLGRGHTLMEPNGPVWSVDASDYHPQLAIGCSDGTCSTTNGLRSTRRGGLVPFFVHKIYQLDYSRKLGEFRMLDHFLPQQTQDRPPVGGKAKAKTAASASQPQRPPSPSTGAWPGQVGIHRVKWNSGNGLAGAGLLASGTASGICRIDWLGGRWMKGKIPYGSVANIRREMDTADDMDVDASMSE